MMKFAFEVTRIISALLAAATAAAATFIGYGVIAIRAAGDEALGQAIESAASLWWLAFAGALAHAVILGLPAYLVLRALGWTRWWVSPICGFAIGCLPSAFYFTPFEDGVSTLAGWIDFIEGVGKIGLLGMAGGIAAWLTWYWLGRAFTRLTAVH